MQTLWFSYDAENRVQVVNGALVNGQIVVAAKQSNSDVASYALHYDAAGHAVSRTTLTAAGATQVAQSTYTLRGQLELEYAAVNVGDASGVVARHQYNLAGQEISLTEYFAPGTIKTYTHKVYDPDTGEMYMDTVPVDVSGWTSHQTLTTYQDGRVAQVSELGRTGQAWYKGSANPALTALSNVFYSNASGGSGYNVAGMLVTYRYQNLTSGYTHTYTTTYLKRDTYLEKSITGTSSDTNYKTTTTSSVYDQMGRRVKITQTTPVSGQTPLTQTRSFSFNASGGILTRSDSGVKQHYVYANGQQVATLGADGKIDAASQLTAFDSSRMGAEPAMVLEGDTLQSIAQRVYGNGSLWYVLAAANAVTDAELVAGSTLKVPSVKTTANDATTFKPFDPNQIQGSTTPSLPYITPPPKHHCNALASVIRIVAAVIVLVVTRNPYAAAAVAGIGETVAQTVEIQDGDRQGYNWAQVATSAVMAGFGASKAGQQMYGSFAKVGPAGKFAYGATMAATSNVVNYSFSKAMGYEAHFNLRGLAADAFASGVSTTLLGRAPGQGGALTGSTNGGFSWTEVATTAIKSAVRQGISYVAHKAIEGQASWNTGLVLGNAIGDAFGNALASASRRSPRRDIGSAGTAETYPLGQDGNPVRTMLLPEGAMGGMSSYEYVSYARVHYGDRVRGNEIRVSPLDGYRDNGVTTTFSPVVVTGHPAQDTWYMSLWDWSNRYNMAPPPVTTNRAALVQYWSDGNKALGPAYATYLKNAYQGQTVSLAQGIPVPNLTQAEFGNLLLKNDLRALGKLALGTVKATINDVTLMAQMGLDTLRSTGIPALLNPVSALLPSIKDMGGGQYQVPFALTDPTEKAGETMSTLLGLAAGAPGLARMAASRAAVGVTRVANNADLIAANINQPFLPQGLSTNPLLFPDGVKMVRAFEAQGWSTDEAIFKAQDLIRTGNSLPVATPLDSTDTLFKLVPTGRGFNPDSSFWMMGDQLSIYSQAPSKIPDAFGLPLQSNAGAYDIYAIKPIDGAVVFQNTVAPTTQGAWIQSGGATQSLMIDRWSFTPPVKVGTIHLPSPGN